jgi:hypothetical protein
MRDPVKARPLFSNYPRQGLIVASELSIEPF